MGVLFVLVIVMVMVWRSFYVTIIVDININVIDTLLHIPQTALFQRNGELVQCLLIFTRIEILYT